jgi:cytosine/adenosine deaminase-related metal-dependent hydrolase
VTNLRIRGGAVFTLDAAGTVYDPGEVQVAGGVVTHVGPLGDLRAGDDDAVLDAADTLVVPGLINPHLHSMDTLVHGTAPAAPLEAWSPFTEAGRYGRTPREIYLSAALTAIEAMRCGTTTILDHFRQAPGMTYEGLEAVAQAYVDVGVRAVVAPVLADLAAADTMPMDIVDLSPSVVNWASRAPQLADEQLAIWDAFHQTWRGRVGVQLGPSAPQRCSDRLLEACAERAQRLGVRVHLHFLESAAQAIVCRRRFGDRVAAHLRDVGVLPHASLVHAVWTREFETIAAAGASVVHCPLANLRLRSGTMAWTEMADAGVPLALGTDGVLCADSLHPLAAAKAAGLLHGGSSPAAAGALLRAATSGGARVCGVDGAGCIEPGAPGDIAVFDGLRSLDPEEQLVYGFETMAARLVVVGGRVVVHDGRVVTADEAALRREARERGTYLAARNAERFAAAGVVSPHLERMALRARELVAAP